MEAKIRHHCTFKIISYSELKLKIREYKKKQE